MSIDYSHPGYLLYDWPVDSANTGAYTSPLIKAILDDNNKLSRDLIAKGVNLNETDYKGRTALMAAAFKGNIQIAQILIDAGAYVNKKNKQKLTALCYSAVNDNKEVARLLIENGSYINVSDILGYTPLMLAATNTVNEVARLLIDKGAKVNASNRFGQTPIHFAAEYNTQDLIRLLINKGADLNAAYGIGETPLFYAAKNVRTDVPRLLIDRGADVNVSDTQGRTPLFYAANNVNADVTRLLVEKGAEINAANGIGETPLFHAAKNENEEVVRMLIDKGAEVRLYNKYGQSPLQHAAGNQNDEVARLLVEKGADVNVADIHGKTPIFFAAANSNKEVARLLIDQGADVNAFDKNRSTPLHFAAENQNDNVARMLLEKGVDVNVADIHGKTPIFFAAANSNKEVARLLIDQGADVNVLDENRNTPLHFAAANQNDEVARMLLEKSVDVNVSNDIRRCTPLFIAVSNQNDDVARMLLNKGADVNVTDEFGNTPLYYAAANQNKEVSRLLIENGVAINAANEFGETPIFQAAENKDEEVLRLLIEKGAEINVSDKDGKTPLFRAAKNTNEELARLLIEKGAEVNVSDKDGKTPLLFSAAENTNEEVARLLIYQDADVNVCDRNGWSPLIRATLNRNEEVTRLLINKGADINIHVSNGIFGPTLLFQSADNQEITQMLIEKGIDVKKSDNDGKSPLFVAAERNNERVSRLLIEKGIDVNKSNIFGETPLLFAAKNNSEDVSRLLIEKGADINARDNGGRSIFYIAIKSSSLEVAQLLLKFGADIDIADKSGRSALFYLLNNKNKQHERETFAFPDFRDVHIIDNGPSDIRHGLIREVAFACKDINTRDHEGRTALHYAVDNMNTTEGLEPLARILIDAGANINMTDNYGNTPLFYAFTPSAARFLLSNGADVHIRNNEHETVLMHIIKRLSKQQSSYRNQEEPELLNNVRLLVNCFEAMVMARDLYGRTAMFCAVMECNTIQAFKVVASILIDNGAVLNDTDNNGVSVLSYFIERYFVYEIKDEDVSEGIAFFTEKGIPNSTVFLSVLGLLHVDLPYILLKRSMDSSVVHGKFCFNVIAVARQYASREQLELMDKLIELLDKKKMPEALDVFLTLGVNPNTADRHGNTALHLATLELQMESNEYIMKVLQTLEKHGARFTAKNYKQETPLHFFLSQQNWKLGFINSDPLARIDRKFVDICEFLLKDGSVMSETTRSGESLYHLIMKLFQRGLSAVAYGLASTLEDICHNGIKLLELFSKTADKLSNVSKKVDNRQNSPLHLWASLSLPSSQSYKSHVAQSCTFQMILDNILKHLISQGVTLNPRNEDEQTPLHLCKTWTAMELLINAGANTCDFDANRRSALLNVAKEATKEEIYTLQYQEYFFFDVKKDGEFFEKCVSLGLDIWSSDNGGESLLSVFLELESYELAKPLIDIIAAKCNSTSIIKQLVDTICKDKSTSTTWKSLLTKTLITSSTLPSKINLDDALRHTCTNIEKLQKQGYSVGFEEERKLDELKDTEEHSAANSSVHVDIARQLLFYGADGNSLCNDYPNLHSLLTATISPEQVEKIIPWTSHSKKHEEKLKAVSRKQNVEKISTYYFHQEPIGHGSFGEVYAGICEKDAREVAIKKIKRSLVNRPQDEREILNLTALADSQQVVTYIFFDDSDKDFVYIVLELMEGHLDDHLANPTFSMSECTMICTYIVQGLKYLHEYKPVPILHRDLKPENILYKFDPQGKLLLKIADFGLSTPLTSGRTTVLHSKAGTRCWIAPEVISSQPYKHSKSSDVFSCGLLLHYILSKQKHPYSPADCTGKTTEVIDVETQSNMLNYKMEGWDDELSPEAKHLIGNMLQRDDSQRPSAADILRHPFFWPNEKKMNLLKSVGNQQVIACPRPTCGPLNALESELENEQPRIIQNGDWTDARYIQTSAIYTNMQTDPRARKHCDTRSVVELVRFIRNSLGHVSEPGRPTHLQKQILDGVFLKEFPDLLMEVYKAVIKHGWNSREEIKKSLEDD